MGRDGFLVAVFEFSRTIPATGAWANCRGASLRLGSPLFASPPAAFLRQFPHDLPQATGVDFRSRGRPSICTHAQSGTSYCSRPCGPISRRRSDYGAARQQPGSVSRESLRRVPGLGHEVSPLIERRPCGRLAASLPLSLFWGVAAAALFTLLTHVTARGTSLISRTCPQGSGVVTLSISPKSRMSPFATPIMFEY